MSSFAKQLREAAAATPVAAAFAEEPVSLTTFVQDRLYLGNPPLSPVQYDAVRHIERIYYPETYPLLAAQFESGKKRDALHIGSVSTWRDEAYWSQPIQMINFATIQWGKGSGKDHIARIACMRIAYLLLCLNSPQQYYRMPEQDTIHLLNVASSSGQAQQAFFMPITRSVKLGWFASRCDPKQNVISFNKNVEAVSGHSDAESQEGLNLMLGIADEIDAFRSKKEMATRRGANVREPTKSAEGIINMIRTSSATRFPEVFKNVYISYPRYLGSTIQQLTAAARADNAEHGIDSRHYVSGPKATWEVNPRVTQEVFAKDYRDNAPLARSMYECKPSRAVNPYFRNFVALDASFVPHRPMPLEVGYRLEEGAKGRTVWVPDYTFGDTLYPVRGARYSMHADMAVSGDRAGVAMAHVARFGEYETLAEDEDGAPHPIREIRPFVKVDFVISYAADPSTTPAREIQIRWARQLCFELIRRGFAVSRFTFDSFQCLSGDVEIPLLDGTSRKLRELVGKEPFWLYSMKDGRIVPGLCTKAWRTGYRHDMVEVELDNGQSVRATSDHRFMLRGGSYQQAGLLRPGDSLMPLYRRDRNVSQNSAAYEQIWHPEPDGSGKRWRFTHSMVSHHIYGKLPKGWVTHHRNFDERDNRPENLEQMTSAAHTALHNQNGRSVFPALWADPEWSQQHRQRISAAQSRAQQGKTGSRSRRYIKSLTFEVIEQTHQECLREGIIPTRAEVQRRLGCSQSALYERVRSAGFRSWKAFRDAREAVSPQALYMRDWKRRHKNNHKVVAVRPGPPEDVFDLQVDEHHNFAIGAGVFVHNSLDSMQILESKNIECERVSTDVNEEPWRNLRDLLYEGRLIIPRPRGDVEDDTHPPPSFLLRDELLSLSRLPNGRVDHPSDGCFTGETRIPLLDGSCPQIQELEGRGVWVYSARPDGTIVPGWARARATRVAKRLVDIVLDSGYTARCTPEHLWMLRDGTYKAAEDLAPGVDRLMPLTRTWPVNGGYERVSDRDGRRTLTHTLVVEALLGRQLQEHELAHHVNADKTDNRPENLQVMDREEHRRHHAEQRWAADPDYVQRLRAGHARWRASPQAAVSLAARDLSARWRGLDTPAHRHAEMARILPFYRHDITLDALRTVLDQDSANAAARALGCGRNVVMSRLRQAGYADWQAFRQACDANHKVRYVIPVELDSPVPVYDLAVDQWHNFALAGGVFVHNSKDEADALACAVLGAVLIGGQEEDGGGRAHYTGPDIRVGSTLDLPLGAREAHAFDRVDVSGLGF